MDVDRSVSRSRPLSTALWLGVLATAAAMVFAAFWPDDLRDGGRLHNALAAARFVLAVLPVHAAVGLLVWALLAAALRRVAVAGTSVALAALLLAWALPLIGPTVPAAEGPTIRVMTANLRYDNAEAAGLLAAVDDLVPDLLLLQEWAPLHEATLGGALDARFPHRAVTFGGVTDIDGVAAFSRFPLREVVLDADTDAAVPVWLHPKAQRLRVDADGRSVEVFNVHPASPQRPAAITGNRVTQRALASLAGVAAEQLGPVVVAGDFNAPPVSAPVRAYAAAGLLDAHAAAGPAWSFGHTWPVGKLPPFVPGVRIDAVWSGGGLVPIACGVGPGTGSDHRPVWADLRFVRSRLHHAHPVAQPRSQAANGSGAAPGSRRGDGGLSALVETIGRITRSWLRTRLDL